MGTGIRFQKIGLEAGALPMALQVGLSKERLPAICIEAQRAHAILKTQRNKTDRNDARGIAELMRTGNFRSVHVKSLESRRIRALLTARRLLLVKTRDLKNATGGILRSFGVKVIQGRRGGLEQRVQAAT